ARSRDGAWRACVVGRERATGRLCQSGQGAPAGRVRPAVEAGRGLKQTMANIRCKNCGLMMQVPAGGRRLCGCGAWLSGDDVPPAAETSPEEEEPVLLEATPTEAWPRIEGDLSAIER